MTIILRRCAGESELLDPALTGEFAKEMALVAAQSQVEPWCGYVAWETGVPLGFGGFKGPPDDAGRVEIGYLTFPSAIGRGVATTVARALLEIAGSNGAVTVVAHTLPEVNASTRVLENAGFERDGWGTDEDVGDVWRWRVELCEPSTER